jgi:hypothetical protein
MVERLTRRGSKSKGKINKANNLRLQVVYTILLLLINSCSIKISKNNTAGNRLVFGAVILRNEESVVKA